MKPVSPLPPLPTSQLGEYRITRSLSPEKSLLGLGHGDGEVVLKMLAADCMQRGQLHPSIRDRLGRVRELAHPGVANLHGVERDAGRAFLVWQYIPGQNLDAFAREAQAPNALAGLARELMLTVESLHALGIVHGAIHARNIIIDDTGRVRLVDVSPLLYDDPAADDAALLATLREIVAKRGWRGSPLGKAIGDEVSPTRTLSTVRAQLAGGGDALASGITQAGTVSPTRRGAMIAAIVMIVVGVLIAAGVMWYARQSMPPPPAPPVISG